MFHRSPSGFMLDFPNGWTASVQFGPGNYCENKNKDRWTNYSIEFMESNTAEVAAWRTESRGEGSAHLNEWYKFEDGQEVKGWQNTEAVMEFLNMISNLDIKKPMVAKRPYDFDWGVDY